MQEPDALVAHVRICAGGLWSTVATRLYGDIQRANKSPFAKGEVDDLYRRE